MPFWKNIIFTIKTLAPFLYVIIAEIAFRKHFHQQVKMVAHQTKA